MPPDIIKLASTILFNPSKVSVTPVSSTVDIIQQYIYFVDNKKVGKILFKNTILTKYSEEELSHFRRDHLGILFQTHYLIPHLTALENVMLAQYFHSMTDKDEARSLLVAVGLEARIHHLPKELSGGERQRVCLARALINQPEILLCDEPTANLDEENKNIVMKLLRQLHLHI